MLGGIEALYIQCTLLLLAGVMLVVKNRRQGGRSTDVFIKDVLKQGAGGLTGHCVGMAAAVTLAHSTHDPTLECGWYLVTFTFDTILGTYLTYKGLRWAEGVLRRMGAIEVAGTGYYPTSSACAKQTLLFVVLVAVARILCGCVVLLLSPLLLHVVRALCTAFQGHPTLFLSTVMLLGPGCLNLVQYYVQDNFLKRQVSPDAKVSDSEEDEGPL